MQLLWCWRCKCEMPMLDEREYAEIAALHRTCLQSVKRYRETTGESLKNTPVNEIFVPMLNHYEVLTGFKETNHNAVMHHRLSLYGPPCRRCGKPLRTPKAKLCGSCMAPVERLKIGSEIHRIAQPIDRMDDLQIPRQRSDIHGTEFE
jgi:hypothetical protein